MTAYFLLSVLCRYRRARYAAFGVSVLIIAGWLVLPYLILPKFVEYCAKGIFERVLGGLPYILTGMLLFKYSRHVANMAFALILLPLSYIFSYFDINIFPLLGGATLFLISYMTVLSDKVIYNKLNTIGIWIYLTHMFNLLLIKAFLIQTNISVDKYVLLFFSFIFTFITSSLLYRLSMTRGLLWLKKLI